MAPIPCWQVDAFTNRPFAGNPAAVCWLDAPADPAWMQSVAAEMNLSETAFVHRTSEGLNLRWFTPTHEVDLCGHATLATAHALWYSGKAAADEPLRFHTKSGWLTCRRAGDFIELDFPATPVAPAEPAAGLIEAMGPPPQFVGRSKFDFVLRYDSADTLRTLRPDYQKLGQIPCRGIIVTAKSDDPKYDFLTRSFFPAIGVNEDPVCGSAHCALTPYWAGELGKHELVAYQASARGGVLRLRLNGDRVILGGQAVTVWQGELM